MEHTYRVYIDPTRKHPKRAIKELVARFPGVELDDFGEGSVSKNESESRALFEEARQSGFRCQLYVSTRYDYNDALSGDLGILHLGPAGTAQFRAVLPKDAFDFSTGCPRCGLGAAQIKPRIISERSLRCGAKFYPGTVGAGQQGDHGILMRSVIGREIVEATGQPWCMRHPMTRAGRVVEEWMEPVPCATMPRLSPKSQGVHFGKTEVFARAGEPPEVVPPCPVCGRNVWDYNREQHTRLLYPRAAIEAAQKHAVVAMYEPYCGFPAFDPAKRTFKDLYGLPWLLFNRAAIEVLLNHIKIFEDGMPSEEIRDSASIEPVFSE